MGIPPYPPLKPLHSDESLNPAKLATMEKLSTENLRNSLVPGLEHCLKTRPDGTILMGTIEFIFFVSEASMWILFLATLW
jgi:hypothetical protein